MGYTAVLSRTVVNSFHYGLTRESQDNLGIENGPIVTFRGIDDLHPGISTLSPETSSTTKFHVPVHNLVDDLSWTKGKHTLQFGTNIRLINNVFSTDASNYNAASTNPVWLQQSPSGSGGSLDPDAFGFPVVDPNNSQVYDNAVVNLVGLVPQVTSGYNRTAQNVQIPQGALVPKHFKSWEYEWYVQDSWHITSNLTITAGLRYTLLEPPYETNGNQVAPDASLNDFVKQRATLMAEGQTINRIISYSPNGQANGKQPFWPYNYKNFGPRLSIAYSPTASGGLFKSLFGGPGKSSIRAGFGIVYDHFGEPLIDTYDASGAFGLNTVVTNAASIQTVDGSARFTGLHDIPVASADGQLLAPVPTEPFPFKPPVSTSANPVQQNFRRGRGPWVFRSHRRLHGNKV